MSEFIPIHHTHQHAPIEHAMPYGHSRVNIDNRPVLEHRPMSELMAIVKQDLESFDAQSLIDEGKLIKTVQYCNEKLGILVREIRQIALPVNNFEAELPLDFEKLYYVCALQATNTMVVHGRDPFDNSFDRDVIYEAQIDRDSFGGTTNYQVIINRQTHSTHHQFGTWTELGIKASDPFCHIDCPNKRKVGKYSVQIKDGKILTPFRCGTLYIMYVGTMRDLDGNITFPFHPMITPWYEWTIKEKIFSNAILNSDMPDLADKFKYIQQERAKAWLEAFDFTTSKEYGYYTNLQRKKELHWYNQYFRFLK